MSIELVRRWLIENYIPGLKEREPRNEYERGWRTGAVWTVRQVLAILDEAEIEEDAQRLMAKADAEAHAAD